MRIAIQGALWSFSHAAALKFAAQAEIEPCAFSRDVFKALTGRLVDAAVIPIENSLAGSVSEHYDLLLQQRVAIRRETRLRIVHHLIAAPGVRLEHLKRAYSHPVALAQCRKFFAAHPGIRAEAFYDTAGAVKDVVAGGARDAAAIAGELAAEHYNAVILERGIQDSKQNFTRFWWIERAGRMLQPEAGAHKATIALQLVNKTGALAKVLGFIAAAKIDVTKIETRPRPGRPFEYVFVLDLVFGELASLRNLLRRLPQARVLGVYPASR